MAILVNGVKIDLDKFPDGTFNLKPDTEAIRKNATTFPCANGALEGVEFWHRIMWRYEREEELVALIYITKFIREQMGDSYVSLFMPYIPNARQDRCHGTDVVFTLRYFAEIINSLKFYSVTVYDPHSDVSSQLIRNISVCEVNGFIWHVTQRIADPDLVFYYPDAGAKKRYSSVSDALGHPCCTGCKKRDFDTGKILGLEIENSEIVRGKNVLIVDDICSRGGTAYYSALALKEAGANDIYCYFTHCENSIFDGQLLTSDVVKKIFTTDSAFTRKHESEKIECFVNFVDAETNENETGESK